MGPELQRGTFVPLTESGANPYRQRGEILFYVYTPPDYAEEGLRPQVAVAKPPDHPEQYLIGPLPAVLTLAKALNILDALTTDRAHRRVNVVVALRKYFFNDGVVEQYTDGKPHTPNLLQRFGIQKRVGTLPGIRQNNPLVFQTDDYTENGALDYTTAAIYWAAVIRHELTHFVQICQSLPLRSLWSERAAYAQESIILLQLINSGRLNKNQENPIEKTLKKRAKQIYDYRNGRIPNNHGTFMEKDGTPLKDQDLLITDFTFGR